MDNNEVEKKLGHKWITDDQLCESMGRVRKYYREIGLNPYSVEWFKPKPKGLPDSVVKAWDTVVQRADDEVTLGIQV